MDRIINFIEVEPGLACFVLSNLGINSQQRNENDVHLQQHRRQGNVSIISKALNAHYCVDEQLHAPHQAVITCLFVCSHADSRSILTGAGGGIGLAIAKQRLSHDSVSLGVGIDVKTSELEALSASHKQRLSVIQGSVADRSTSQRAVAGAIDRRGKLDAIILNAGILRPVGRAAESDVEDWKKL